MAYDSVKSALAAELQKMARDESKLRSRDVESSAEVQRPARSAPRTRLFDFSDPVSYWLVAAPVAVVAVAIWGSAIFFMERGHLAARVEQLEKTLAGLPAPGTDVIQVRIHDKSGEGPPVTIWLTATPEAKRIASEGTREQRSFLRTMLQRLTRNIEEGGTQSQIDMTLRDLKSENSDLGLRTDQFQGDLRSQLEHQQDPREEARIPESQLQDRSLGPVNQSQESSRSPPALESPTNEGDQVDGVK